MKRAQIISLHIFAWVFFVLNVLLTYPSQYVEQFGMFALGVKTATFYLVMSIGFYTNYLLLTPKLLATKRYVIFILAVLLLQMTMVGAFLLHALFLDWYLQTGSMFMSERLSVIPYLAFEVLFFLLISTGARFSADWFRMQKMREELKKEKEQAELALLRQQLSPHFLFNTLNNIYSLTVHRPAEAPAAMLRLSELMRSVLRSIEKDEVDLENEVTQLCSFIDLKRLRYPEDERISFGVTGNVHGVRLHPMLLLPLAENAFKHGDLHSPDTSVNITLSVDDHRLIFTVENTPSEGSRESTSGIGLQNVRRRLELLYPGRFELHIDSTPQKYVVVLQLRLA
jgi:sensor histidine kinase YesM